MSNTLVTPQVITNETLRIMHNSLVLSKKVKRDNESAYGIKGAKAGQTIQIRRPNQFTVRSGPTLSTQEVVEATTALTLQPLIGVDWVFDDTDLAMTIDRFSERYLKPAALRLASELDSLLYKSMYKSVWNTVGTPGTTPSTALTWLQAGQKLDESATPRDNSRVAIMNPAAQVGTVDGLKGLFQSSSKVSEQYESGEMGESLGMKFMMSQNAPTHTVGPQGGTPTVNGAGQGSAGAANAYTPSFNLVTAGWTAAAAARLKAGDVITIANVNAVNPETKQKTGSLAQFVVGVDVSSDGTGAATLSITPCPISGGAYQNVDALPATGAAITVVGAASTASPVNLVFHPEAFTLVVPQLELPNGTDMAARSEYEGFSLRFVRDFDITNNRRICRFDLLWGAVAQRPEFACRVQG
jgi:hypothetical protein